MEYLLGVVVSLVVEWAKKYLGTDTLGTHAALLAVSIVGAAAYVWFKDTSFWPLMVQTIMVAAAFHNLILRKFE